MERRTDLATYARNMRTINYTDAERKLWQILRNRQLKYKFTRQYVFDNRYIVDFMCAEKKLVIEVDGGQHNDNLSDNQRDSYLKTRGYTVLRFWNNDIMDNIEGCITIIQNTLEKL